MRREYLLLAFLWAAYCTVHSALIAVPVTEFLRRVLGFRYRFYRLFFNLISLGALAPLVIWSNAAEWKTEVIFAWGGYLRIVQWSLIALAALLVFAGARHYSMLQFLGIQQLRNPDSHGAMTSSGQFDSSGVLGVIRHPWYLAVFILLWARDLNLAEITISLVLSAYLVIGTILEERKLVLEFGPEYREYQNRVSMLLPLKWPRRTLGAGPGTSADNRLVNTLKKKSNTL